MKKMMIYLIILLLFVMNVNALIDVKIEIQEEFKTKDFINFNYTITSDANQQIIFIPHSECPNAPISFLQQKQANLLRNEAFTDTYYDITIDSSIEPQTCTASVQILSPIQQKVEKTFKIVTNPGFEFNIVLPKKTFTKGESISINYDSSVEKPTITTTLTFPDKSTQQLTLPTTIKAKQIGTYEIESTAIKEGYKTQTVKEQFGVIEKSAEIESSSVCNADGVCSNEENVKNCPQDCKTKDKDLVKKSFIKGPILYTLLITIILIIVLFLGIYFKRKKNSL